VIEATVETALLFDRTASTRMIMTGKDRKDLLHRLSTNDILGLEAGRGTATLLLERNGRLIERLLVVDRGEDLLLLGNPGRAGIVREWIEKFTILEDSKVRDVSADTSEFLLIGPQSTGLLESTFGDAVSKLERYDNLVADPGTPHETTVVRGEDYESPAYAVICGKDAAATVLEKIGLVAKASDEMLAKLRIKAGIPSWGSEYDERTIPLEARLVDAISFTKGCYVGQEIIARVHHHKRVKRLLCRMEIEGEAEPAPQAEIFHEEEKVGWITGATASEYRCFALGYVESGFDAPGTALSVADGGLRRTARILSFNPEGDPRWPA
jgi:folate-binding protein YgfZ